MPLTPAPGTGSLVKGRWMGSGDTDRAMLGTRQASPTRILRQLDFIGGLEAFGNLLEVTTIVLSECFSFVGHCAEVFTHTLCFCCGVAVSPPLPMLLISLRSSRFAACPGHSSDEEHLRCAGPQGGSGDEQTRWACPWGARQWTQGCKRSCTCAGGLVLPGCPGIERLSSS